MRRQTCTKVLCAVLLAGAASVPVARASSLEFSATYHTTYDEQCGADDSDDGCAEISAYDPATGRIFTTNGSENLLRVLNLTDSGELTDVGTVDLSPYGDAPNSVAVSGNYAAVAVQAEDAVNNGTVIILNTSTLEVLQTIEVGALPDMVIFTPNGEYLLVANEGEPNDDYTVDPEGTISVISVADWSVRTADFSAFNNTSLPGARIFGPGASVAQDLEPEYIAVSPDSLTAWVTLQENNALAIVDISTARVLAVKGLGYKDHSITGNSFDASNRDGGSAQCALELGDDECIRLNSWPTLGMYQPDAIDAYQANGMHYVISANEGDARDYDGYSEEFRVGDDEIVLDPTIYPNGAALKEDSELGRLKMTLATGDSDGDGDIDQIYSYGARSFSIWNWSGDLVFDSGNDFETRLAAMQQAGDAVWVDSRSDDKGPEPESVTTGTVAGKTFAFIGLERVSGVFVYDVTDPAAPHYTGYINTNLAGDISPEGLIFVPTNSSGGVLVVTNEISNTISTYQISFGVTDEVPDDQPTGGSPNAGSGVIALDSSLYWQVQRADNFSTLCEGFIDSCETGAGIFNVIDLTSSVRYKNFIVEGNANDANGAMPMAAGNTISWPGDDWWQVQRADTQESICEGREPCTVTDGTYTVINLTTGDRFERFRVGNSTNDPSGGTGFKLQLLHAADMDGVAGALINAPHFSALVDHFRAGHANTLTLSSGDNYIPGPRFFASAEDSLANILGIPAAGRADIALHNAMGFQASAVGNHELDTGTAGFASIFAAETADDGSMYVGASFPYLSSNLDFSSDENLASLVGANGSSTGDLAGQLAAYATIDINGETIGVIGATTPSLSAITSAGDIGVAPAVATDIDGLAAAIQPSIDALIATGVNKIILLAHMQQIAIERSLASRLSGVDIIIAGGSNTLLADSNDVLRPGDAAAGNYPEQYTAPTGEPVLVVNTDGDYKYLGRLVVDFDHNGHILTDSLDESVNGAWAATADTVNQLGAVANQSVTTIADAISAILAERDGNIIGKTSVYLDGRRNQVRTQETNMGNLTADANLWLAQQADPSVAVSLKNGGGIRADIGLIVQPPGTNDPALIEFLPPAANAAVGKQTGDISQFDIQQVLRFNNGLVLLSATAAEFLDIMEHSVAASEEGATPGRFPQVAGMRFEFNPSATARDGGDINGAATTPGQRIWTLQLIDSSGQTIDTVVSGGLLQGDPNRVIRFVTLDFLAQCVGVVDGACGDGYPFNGLTNPQLLSLENTDPGMASFADAGSEQDAFSEYLLSRFSETPFNEAETAADADTRIVNLNAN